MDDGKISFIIRSKNEERYIGYSIQSVLDFFGPRTKIIIVDNESTDETLQNIALFPKRFYNIEVITIKSRDYTPGKSLNLGISHVTTPFVGILSAHSQLACLDIPKLYSYFENDNCFGIIGKQIPIYKGKKITPKYIWENFLYNTPQKDLIENVPQKRYFFHNAFSFIRHLDWQKVHFDEDLQGKEDRFWAEKLVETGKHFYLEPDLICYHHWTTAGATWKGLG